MPEVGVRLAYTLQIRPYETARFELAVDGIDTEKPVEPQLQQAAEHIRKVFAFLENELYERFRESGLLKEVAERDK